MIKKLFLLIFFLINTNFLIAQVGINTTSPDNSSILDVFSSDKGVLFPRVSLSNITDTSIDGTNAAATGLFIYNTNASIVGGDGIGYYYFDGTIWKKLQDNAADKDFFEENTTTAPDDINDDIYTMGNVAIGKTDADYTLDLMSSEKNRNINNKLENTSTSSAYGHFLESTHNGSGNNFGTYRNLMGNGSGIQYAARNIISNAGDGNNFGVYNTINNNGNGNHYGIYNTLGGSGTGFQFGVRNIINNSNNNQHFGVYNTLRGGGNGLHFGVYNLFDSTGSGINSGLYNIFNGSGSGDVFGIRQYFYNSDTNNIHYGLYNYFDTIGNGIRFGVQNNIVGTGNGPHYGSYNSITSTGSNFHIAVFGRAKNGGNLQAGGYFESDSATTNSYAAIFNSGHVVANLVGEANDFTIQSEDENYMFFLDGSENKIGIGSVTPTTTLHIEHPSIASEGLSISNATNNKWHFNHSTTNNRLSLYYNNTLRGHFNAVNGNYTSISDRSLKTNIKKLNSVLSKIQKLEVVEYNFKNQNNSKKHIGFIAQEVEKTFPELVSKPGVKGGNKYYTLDYSGFGILAIKSIQEQQEIIEVLKNDNTKLQNTVNKLKELIEKQEERLLKLENKK